MKSLKKNNIKHIHNNYYFYNYYLKTIILKFFQKRSISYFSKNLIKLKSRTNLKKHQISRQLNICKVSGTYKKTFNKIGLNRHQLRNFLNINKIIHIKKFSW